MMAPATSWIWICHRGSGPTSFLAATIPRMANVGPKNEKVPPCTTGSLLPKGDCWIRVHSPEVKKIVEISNASCSGGRPMAPPTMKGMSTVAPNMVRYC